MNHPLSMRTRHLFTHVLASVALAVALLIAPAWARDSVTLDSIPAVSIGALPPEARATLELIRKGGPFPYRRDGVVFQNREKRLPIKAGNYYREYTVPTPGSSDRGARRIIAGSAQEYFYTADHYRSFRRIQP